MSTWLAITLLIALFVGVCLGAGLAGRWLREAAKNDYRTHYRAAWIWLIIYGAVAGLMVVMAFRNAREPILLRILSSIFWGLLFLFFFRKWLLARRQYLAHPQVLRPARPTRPAASFLWQAVFILLPVALMSGFGFWAILHERNAVEMEARQRAQEVLHSLPGEFGRAFANQLTDLQARKTSWYGYLEGGVAAWPGDNDRRFWMDDTNESLIISNHLRVLHAAFPEWQDGPVPLVQCNSDTNGAFAGGSTLLPGPPDWLLALTPAQASAWAEVQAARDSESISNAVEDFRQTQPPPAALDYGKFLVLRAGLAQDSTTNAISRLLRFGERHCDAVSDGGLSVPTLALAAALDRARASGPTADLWHALRTAAASPDLMTPRLLDQAALLVASDAMLSEGVRALRILHGDKLAEAELAEAVRETGKVKGITTTNLWVKAMGWQWLCILHPNQLSMHTSVSNRPVEFDWTITECDGFPDEAVGVAFDKALAGTGVLVPEYFSLSLEVEGREIPLRRPGSKSGDALAPSEALAGQSFQMFEPAILRKHDAVTGKDTDVPFEAMPGHPQFSVQVLLTDRSLLYARQRQLQWIFGTLIGASALAAMIGVLAAYRAFRREQMYGEMKSNFVSSVSHELRAPIASVRLMAENLERGKIPDAARQGEYFRFIVQECRRLSALIENVLDFSRIEQGRKQYEAEPTDLAALTETTVKLMTPYAAEKGVHVKLEALPVAAGPNGNGGIEMDVDGRALQQALVNLIDNAVKHSPKDGTVAIALQKSVGAAGANHQSSVIRLSVIDHGPGIPASEHEKIFERFYRLGSELRRETQGVGIGLSVVKHIVEAHGGRVLVESEPGRGSRFTIELPLRK